MKRFAALALLATLVFGLIVPVSADTGIEPHKASTYFGELELTATHVQAGTDTAPNFSAASMATATHIPVTSITGVPTTATAGTPLTLTGTANPAGATNTTIIWSVYSAGTTGATISGSTLYTTAAGTVTVRATIANGTAVGSNYTQNFNIAVSAATAHIPVTSITGVPTTATAGTPLKLDGTVNPSGATYTTIAWSIISAGATGASISGDTLTATAAGTVAVRATITNGTAVGSNYTQNFNIEVSAAITAAAQWSPRTSTLEMQTFYSTFGNWAQPITSYLTKNSDGSITTIEASPQNEVVTVKTSDSRGVLLSSIEIAFELPLFGAYFSGEQYNYIVFGQTNTEQSNTKEVIRIVKYDKNFRKLGSASITGGSAQTRIPFSNGCPRLAENGTTLILHMSRQRYTSSDGLNHQSNLTISVNTNSMSVNSVSALFPENHVSHSFDQYVLFDGSVPVLLDHGDAYPRSIVLHKETQSSSSSGTQYAKATMFNIPGTTGDNWTGVTLGGFAMSGTNYLVALSTVDHSASNNRVQRDVIICAVPRSLSSGSRVVQTTIGKYVGTDKTASAPRLISNGDNTFSVLWQEFAISSDQSRPNAVPGAYVVQTIDASGRAVGSGKQYSDIAEFYKEFLNVTALPSEQQQLESSSEWARGEIQDAIDKGLLPLELRCNYRDPITRAEFCALAVALYESLEGTIMGRSAFVDTSDVNVQKAAAVGIVNGVGDNRFDPNGLLTREQAATMLARLADAAGISLPNQAAAFSDNSSIASWAIDAVGRVQAARIMEGIGNNTFSPKGSYTREQSIATIMRTHNVLGAA